MPRGCSLGITARTRYTLANLDWLQQVNAAEVSLAGTADGSLMSLALIVLLPFLGAVLPALMIRSGRDACAIATGSITTLALALLLTNVPAVLRGEVVRA